MNLHLGYLTIFVIYLVIVLVIGVWGFRRESYSAYLVAEKNMGLPLAVGTFFATYISSATVIGFTGYVTLSGSAVFPTYFWGFALGWVTLLLLAGRMRSLELRTVPELFEVRFQNGSLRSLIAAFIVVSFAFTVMTQLVAGSIVLETIVGIPQLLALVLIAFVLTIYTMLGGLISVIRTDFLQGSLLLIGVLAAFGIVVSRLGSDIFDLDPQQSTWFAGSIGSSWDILAFLLITWGGVSAQPYYLHRFYAAKNVVTARQMIGVGAILAGITYVAVAFIGFGLPKLIPEEQLGDSAIPFFALNSGNVMGSLLLIAIICAIQSTVDSALHLTGVYTSEDIIARYRGGMSDRRRLTTARTVTAIFGTICTLTAIYFAISGGPIVELVNLWLGTLSSALLLPLLAALFWPRATAAGAISGSVGGFLAYFGTAVAQFLQVPIAINPIFMGMGASAVLLIVVSMTTTPVSDQSVLHRFFGSGSHTG